MTGAARPARIDLEVERLVLDDPGRSPAAAARLRALVEAEIGRLLAQETPDLPSRATPLAAAPLVALPRRADDQELASRLARAVVRALEEG
jgi:hypothetical protein